ncbi:HPP family protein [Thiomicrorhabdus sp.]|uniref:HPP family protein n=1 Tax=Thiomicrorhabdus sp. TaxID=2039724 RepID=UPI003563BB66
MKWINTAKQFLGINPSPVSHSEKIISAVGGFIALFVILTITQTFLGLSESWGIIASMGASAVLLFVVPKGPLSQPWSLLGGHVLSAIVGVSCALWIDDPLIAAACAVGLSIAVMYYLNCVHPPGGATALYAVIGGENIHAMGYEFVITPVLLDALAILGIAILFNSLFYWRRYPAFLQQRQQQVPTPKIEHESISHEDFLQALKQVDSFVDVNEHDLRRIFDLANLSASKAHLLSDDIELGAFYSNGQLGKDWSVRRIIDESVSDDPAKDFVIFKQVAGQEAKRSDCMTRSEFARWAKYRVMEENGSWKRYSPE